MITFQTDIKQVHLIAAVKRQPGRVDLSHTNVRKDQLEWLLQRLFELKELRLQNCSSVLLDCFKAAFPFLTHLDLSWLSTFNHLHLNNLFSSQLQQHPGVDSTTARFANLLEFRIAGTEVDDSSIKLISQHLRRLRLLDISFCINVTHHTITFLTNPLQHIPEDEQSEKVSPANNIKANGLPCGTPVNAMPNVLRAADNETATTTTDQYSAYIYCPLPQLTTLLIKGCNWIDSQVLLDSQRPNLQISLSLE